MPHRCANPQLWYTLASFIAAIILLATLSILFHTAQTRNVSIDWPNTYYPAARSLLQGRNPYQDVPIFFAPPWTLLPLIPFALFSIENSTPLFFVFSLLAFAFLAYKMRCSPVSAVAFLLSAPVICCLSSGNIEWLPLLGAFLPAPIGIVFLAMKPHLTIAVIALLLARAYRRRGIMGVTVALLPILALFLLSLLLYGPWFLRIFGALDIANGFVFTAWPWSLLPGLLLLILAIRRNRLEYALAASPLLSPYAVLSTWSGFVLSFARSPRRMLIVSISSWLLWLAFRFI